MAAKHISSRLAALLSFSAAAVVGCTTGRGNGTEIPALSPGMTVATGAAADDEEDEEPSTAQEPSATGQDAGALARCNFRVKDSCYETEEEACAAAGCEPSACRVLESHPARVTCE